MKMKISIVVVLVSLFFAGCSEDKSLPIRIEAFTNEFHVVNFVSTNKVFIAKEDGMMLRMTGESPVALTNGQAVTAEAMIMGYPPGGRITHIIVYPRQ